MKKVIYFTSSHTIGLTSLLAETACRLNETRLNRFIFVSGEKEQFPGLFDKLEEFNLDYRKIDGLDEHADFWRLNRELSGLIKDFGPHVLHVQTNWQLALALASRYASKEKFKIIYTIHGYRNSYWLRAFVARYLIGSLLHLFSDKVITPSSFLKDKFSFLGDNKLRTIFLGLEESYLGSHEPPKFGSPRRLIFAGRFSRGKNQDLIIRVLSKYITKTGDKNIRIYLPGTGERLEYCKGLARNLGIEGNVLFPGFLNREQMLQHYLKCQYALVPSSMETFGQCISEPFALGRVVITRHVGVADDIITDGKTGFFFDSEEDLLDMLCLVLPDKIRCQAVSAKAASGRNVFSWDNICTQYNGLIKEL